MRTTRLIGATFAALSVFSACRAKNEVYRDSAMGQIDSGTPKVIVGAKTDTTAHDTTVMDLKDMTAAMEVELKALDTAKAPTIQAQLPQHIVAASRLVKHLDDEMQREGKATVPEWRAIVDSVRQDLVRMPEMSVSEIMTYMPSHHARLEQLMKLGYANVK